MKIESRKWKNLHDIGTELYIVDDLKKVFESDIQKKDFDMNASIVVVDMETTGLSPLRDEIIRIDAIRVINGEIVDTYQRFVKPKNIIAKEMLGLTGITEMDIMNATSVEEVLPELLEYIGNDVMISYHMSYIYNFIEENADRLGIKVLIARLDVEHFARRILLDLNIFTFQNVVEFLGIDSKRYEKEDSNVLVTLQIYKELCEKSKTQGIHYLHELNNINSVNYIKNLICYPVLVIAKNQKGNEDLDALINDSCHTYFYRRPKLPLSKVLEKKDTLLVGSGNGRGLLQLAFLRGKSSKEIERIAKMYDFLEVQSVDEDMSPLIKSGCDPIATVENIEKMRGRICALGEKLNIPVVVTSWEGPAKTHGKLMKEFEFLGKKKAQKVIIENVEQIMKANGFKSCRAED